MIPEFLDVADILEIHEEQIREFGGLSGIRDQGLLESAAAQPSMSFGGEFMHPDLFRQAAAYLFHLCKNHPVIDGNKRTTFTAAFVFLHINGIVLESSSDELYDLTIAVAEGRLSDKAEIAARLRAFAGR